VPQITIVVGNPRAGSRTRRLAEEVARQIAELAGQIGKLTGPADTGGERGRPNGTTVIELADHTDVLFDWSSPVVGGLVDQVLAADLLVVASPTFKGTYTGLLKVFLDRFGADQLGALPTVPVMTGGRPEHALAVEHTLRPLLVEIGASTPTRGLYVVEADLEDPAVPVKSWLDRWGAALVRAL
jgi:FMN reductase